LVNNGSNYAPKANISRDGQFIAFNSNWGNAAGRHDVYVVKIPPAPGVPLPPDTIAPSPPTSLRVAANGGEQETATWNVTTDTD
jgi:hypothetical protein